MNKFFRWFLQPKGICVRGHVKTCTFLNKDVRPFRRAMVINDLLLQHFESGASMIYEKLLGYIRKSSMIWNEKKKEYICAIFSGYRT